MPRLSTVVLAAALGLVSATSAAAQADPMICLVNAARQSAGVAPLGISQGLQNAAWRQASDMARTGQVSHFGSDGSNPLTRLSYLGYSKIGENVAGGQSTAQWALDSFLGSPGHRATLMDPAFTCFGSAQVGLMWAQEYGTGPGCWIPNCNGYRRRARSEVKVDIADTFVASIEVSTTSSADGTGPAAPATTDA
ncbi:hypothetical protein DFJ74DRAFT_682780 [Hyaloraphidium curvatum]|nr:hypothetical protein DFJ74DRAFT_682780 [Hyaloraphidium curvatum]